MNSSTVTGESSFWERVGELMLVDWGGGGGGGWGEEVSVPMPIQIKYLISDNFLTQEIWGFHSMNVKGKSNCLVPIQDSHIPFGTGSPGPMISIWGEKRGGK